MNINPITIELTKAMTAHSHRRRVFAAEGFSKNLAAPPSAEAQGTYTVRHGDTLWDIAEARLRASGYQPTLAAINRGAKILAQANALENPDLILPGQQLNLAALTDIPAGTALSAGGPLTSSSWPSDGSPPAPRLFAPGGRASHLPGLLSSLETKGAESSLGESWDGLLEGSAKISSYFGMRKDPFTGRRQHHNGLDLAVPAGTPVCPQQEGEVVFSGWRGGYGKVVIVQHDNGLKTTYGHLSKRLVATGDRIAAGAVVGLVGSTGRSTGPHLHFEVQKAGKTIDPLALFSTGSFQVAQVS